MIIVSVTFVHLLAKYGGKQVWFLFRDLAYAKALSLDALCTCRAQWVQPYTIKGYNVIWSRHVNVLGISFACKGAFCVYGVILDNL